MRKELPAITARERLEALQKMRDSAAEHGLWDIKRRKEEQISRLKAMHRLEDHKYTTVLDFL